MSKDYYELLGVEENASPDDIKSAFRKKSMLYHPDRATANNLPPEESEQKFKDCAEAYEVLSDPQKRAQYNQIRHGQTNPFNGNSFNPFSGFPFGDIFISPHWNGGKVPIPGDPIDVTISVPLIELFSEHIREIEINRKEFCESCKGSGLKDGKTKNTCRYCKGSGKVGMGYTKSGMRVATLTNCPDCGGEGIKAAKEDSCSHCLGMGTIEKQAKISVRIPAGMPYGAKRLVVRGEGNVGSFGGNRGDVFVVLINSDPKFDRLSHAQADLVYKAEIPYWKAVLGGSIDIPHPKGSFSLTVPSSCQNGYVECVNGRGLPVLGRSEIGNLHVIYSVTVPKNPSEKEVELLKKLKAIDHDGENNYVKQHESAQNWSKEESHQENSQESKTEKGEKGEKVYI